MSLFKGIQFAPILTQIHAQAFSEPWSTDTFSSLLKLPTTLGWANEYGFLLVSDLGDTLEILTLAILPQHQRQGLATQLLLEMCNWAKQQGKKAVFLEVAQDNDKAKSLYTKLGFQITGKRSGYYKRANTHIDAICMTLSL